MLKKIRIAICCSFLLALMPLCNALDIDIRVDKEHSQIGANNENAPSYVLTSKQELSISYDNFVFDIWGKPETPDTLSVIISDDQKYNIKLDPSKATHIFTAKDFSPSLGSKKFTGFKSGDTAMIALGNYRIDSKTNTEKFRVQWLGMATVK